MSIFDAIDAGDLDRVLLEHGADPTIAEAEAPRRSRPRARTDTTSS
jgi:hypothetical protein